MSTLESKAQAAAGAKHREPSAEKDASKIIFTWAAPPPRNIPLPEFYPTERTSTASFKAPVTSMKKKPEPPPPAPGTISTAINYISSPVKYISSMFSGAPTPEPIKTKERHFKIDLEKEREKQVSPKIPTLMKKVQNVIVEEVEQTPAKPEKNQGSAWRRKNLMDTKMYPPLSPKAQKFRTQSPKRLPPSILSNTELTPTNVSHLTISSSSAQNSFKVMSKIPPEEPEKKKKKDPRKITNGRLFKETPVATNFNKSNPRYKPPLANRYSLPSSEEEYPVVPFPTILPPRVPPATYTIRSIQNPKTAEKDAPKEPELAEETEPENPGTTALATTATDQPELLSCVTPRKFKTFEASGLNESSSVDLDGDEEPRLQETLGKLDIGDMIKVSRLDQLPSNRFKGANNAFGLRGLFHDATLMKNDTCDVSENATPTAAQIGPTDIVLCASSIKYPSPNSTSIKVNNHSKTSPGKGTVMKRPSSSRQTSLSPARKRQSPSLIRTEVKQPQPLTIVSSSSKETLLKNQKAFSLTPKPDALRKVTQPLGTNTSQARDIALKSDQLKKIPSPPSKESNRKTSPLKVEDKHVAAVEESLGRSLRPKRSRVLNTGRTLEKSSPTQEQRSQPPSTSVPLSKPNIVKKVITKKKDSPPEQSVTSSALSTAAITAATAVATAAITSALQQHQDQDKATEVPVSTQGEQAKPEKVAPRSPPSLWKADRDGGAILPKPSSLRPHSPKVTSDLLPHQAGDSAVANNSGKNSTSMVATKDMLKKNGLPKDKNSDSVAATQETGYNNTSSDCQLAEDTEDYNCLENYCGDPAKFFHAATMMGEIP